MAEQDMGFAVERGFLAQEFLTWLWFRCEVEGGEFELSGREVGFAVEDALSLTAWDPDGAKVTIRGGMPTLRPEAAGALGSGLLLRKAKLIMAESGREWTFTLDGETLDLGSVKTPQVDDDEDEADPLAEKLRAAEEVREAVDLLFEQFVGLRLGPDWEGLEVPRMRDWIRVKLERAIEDLGLAVAS